jgi:hypothetical protein
LNPKVVAADELQRVVEVYLNAWREFRELVQRKVKAIQPKTRAYLEKRGILRASAPTAR